MRFKASAKWTTTKESGARKNLTSYLYSECDKGAKLQPTSKGEGRNGSEIHVPIDCDLMIIDSAKHMEHSSNEEQIGEGRYFGGGVFIAVSRLFNGTNRCNPQATLVKFEH